MAHHLASGGWSGLQFHESCLRLRSEVRPMPHIAPIEDNKKTIAGLVLERIRDAILNATLSPGSRIDQRKLAADLNVSIVPVREALKKLEGEGFVQIIPRRGAFVTQTSISDMEDLYFARAAIEG